MLVVNSPFGLAVLHPDIAVAGISPSRLFSNISQTKPTLTPISVSLLATESCHGPDFSFRFLRPFKSWHPRMTNKLC